MTEPPEFPPPTPYPGPAPEPTPPPSEPTPPSPATPYPGGAYPGPAYPGSAHPGTQYPGTQYPPPQYPPPQQPGPWSAYPGQQPGWPVTPPPPSGTNKLAIVALVTGILGTACFSSIVFGIIAVVQTNKSGQKGRGLAIAGLVISGLWLVGGFTAGVISAINAGPERNAAGEITDAGEIQVFDLQVGDCIEKLKGLGEVTRTLQAVPCSDLHRAEVYALVPQPDGPFPGDEAVKSKARAGCTAAAGALRVADVPRDAQVHWLQPSEDDWPDHHRIICMVETSSEQTGSLRK